MTLQTDIDTAVAQVTADSQKLKDVVNGPASGSGSVITVTSGTVKSVARALAEIGDTSNQALKDMGNVLDSDFIAKAIVAGVDGDLKALGNLAGLGDVTVARSNLGLTKGTGIGNVVEVQTGGKIATTLYDRHTVSVTQATLGQNASIDIFTNTDAVTAKKRLVQIYEEELGSVLSEDFVPFSKPFDIADTSTWASVESFLANTSVVSNKHGYGVFHDYYMYLAPGGLTANGDTDMIVQAVADATNTARINVFKYDSATNSMTSFMDTVLPYPWRDIYISHMGGTRYMVSGFQNAQWDTSAAFLDITSAGLTNVSSYSVWGNQYYTQSIIYLAPGKGVLHTNNGASGYKIGVVTDNGNAAAPSIGSYAPGALMGYPCRVDDTHFLLPMATNLVKLMKVTGSTVTIADSFSWAGHATYPGLSYVRLASGKIWAFSQEASEAKIVSVVGDVMTVEATVTGLTNPAVPTNWHHKQRTTMKEITLNTFIYLKRNGTNPYSINLTKMVIDEVTAALTVIDLGEILSTTDLGDAVMRYQITGDGPDWLGDHAMFQWYAQSLTDSGAWAIKNASQSGSSLDAAYAFSFDGGFSFRIWNGTAAKDIASNNSVIHGGVNGNWYYWDGMIWQADASNSRDTATAAAIDADPGNVTTDVTYAALVAADWSSFGWTAGVNSSFSLFAYERNPAKLVASVGVGYTSMSSWIMNLNPAEFRVNSMAAGKVSVSKLSAGVATVRVIILSPKE